MSEHTTKAFGVVADGTGFCCVQLRINGFTLSMNVGRGGYNDNHWVENVSIKDRIETDLVECAVFDSEDRWVTKDFFLNAEDYDYSVAPYCSMEQVQNAILKIMAVKSA